jgi:hypothetical protein
MTEAEALDFYQVMADNPAELVQTRFSGIVPERRRDFATSCVDRWQGELAKLAAHLGGSASADAAAFIAAEQARINEAWEIIPTL